MATVTKEQARKFYETMATIRAFEESVKRDFLAGEIPGFVHLYIGEEAIGTGICAALRARTEGTATASRRARMSTR